MTALLFVKLYIVLHLLAKTIHMPIWFSFVTFFVLLRVIIGSLSMSISICPLISGIIKNRHLFIITLFARQSVKLSLDMNFHLNFIIKLFQFCKNMCLNPKRILNRSLHWNEGKPLYLTVPCGHCEECKSRSRNDWFVRAYFEWQRPHTQTYFYTLTYSEDHLPKYENIPCFSKRDIQLFLKRFRYYLKLHDVTLKYIICSEFGTLRHRPHYHALFFLSRPFSPYLLYRIIQDSWQNGFVKYGDNYGVVSSSAGIQYVVKYITKDEQHLDKYFPLLRNEVYMRYDRLLNYLQRRFSDLNRLCFLAPVSDGLKFAFRDLNGKKIEKDDALYPFVSKFLSKVNSIVLSRIPFHLQSSRLAVGVIENHLSLDDLLREEVTLNNKGSFQSYNLPHYFKRLFWYDRVENEIDGKKTIYKLSDLGVRHLLERDSLLLEKKQCELSSVLHDFNNVTDDLVKLVCDSTGTLFKNKYDLIFWLQHFDLDLRVLSIYSVYFRDRVNFGVLTITKETVLDSYLDYAEYCLTTSFNYDFGKIYEKYCGRQKSDIFHFATWNNHPFFVPYERALQVLETCSLAHRIKVANAKHDLEENKRKLRELINNCFTSYS